MGKVKQYRKYIGIAAALAAFIIIGSFIPGYFSLNNILNVTRQSSTIAICAMGMTVVLITKGIDLATGGMMAFCAMIGGMCMLAGINVYLSILIGLVIGAGFGLLNGMLIAKIEIPPFIATYVMGQIATGFALVLGKGSSIGGMPEEYAAIGNNTLFGIPILTIIMLVFLLITSTILSRTRMGKHIYALGGNELTVKLEGINVDRVKLFAYMFSGVCAAAAGIMLSAQMNTVHPTQGSTYQLDAVAASVIGGVSMLGGSGKAWMAVVGALVIGFLRNALTLLGMHPYYQNLVVGAAIIIVVGLSVYNRNKILEAAKVF
jgi:ribose transport system permease protein